MCPLDRRLDSHVAAGIAIQCAGWDEFWNPNSGVGIAQITKNETETEWGQPIYKLDWRGNKVPDIDPVTGEQKTDRNNNLLWQIRSYGLRCPDSELEKALNPNNTKDAVILMKRRIQLVTNECKGCTSTDIYIAAGLAQNGPGFVYKDMRNGVAIIKPRVTCSVCVSRDWKRWFETGQPKNNQDQLWRFNLVINELISRGWPVPFDLDTTTIKDLPNVKVIK